MNAYTVYLTRSNTVAGFISKQEFATLDAAQRFAVAYAVRWVIKHDDQIVSRGSRN